MSKNIKILAIPSDAHGVGKYRIIDPYTYLDKHNDDITVDVVFDVPNKSEFFTEYDIVIFHSFIHKLDHKVNIARIKWLKRNGIVVIMDVDDYWNVDTKHPLYKKIKETKFPKRRVEMLKEVDYVTTTTEYFRNTIKNKAGINNVLVFENAINPEEEQFTPKPIPSERIRFGWVGGSTHLHDLKLLRDCVNVTYSTLGDKIKYVICGFDTRGTVKTIDKNTGTVMEKPIKPTDTVWKQYEDIFTHNYEYISESYKKFLTLYTENVSVSKTFNEFYQRNWTKPINEYGFNYNEIDVSLIPIFDNEFNRNKSPLKIIEAGFHKKPVIASESQPYVVDLVNAFDKGKFTDGNALLVSQHKNHKQWTQHVKRLVDNPNMRIDLGERLYETVKVKYSLPVVSKKRSEFLKSL